MLRSGVDATGVARWENTESPPTVAAIASPPPDFVPKSTAVLPAPEPLPSGRWRRRPKPIGWPFRLGYVAFCLLAGVVGYWSLIVLALGLAGFLVVRWRRAIGPDAPVRLSIWEIVEGGTAISVGTDSGIPFLDGDALAWHGDGCSFRIGGQDVAIGRASFEMTLSPPPDETFDVLLADGRRLRLRFAFGKRRQSDWKAIREWARRRPVDRAPREAPPDTGPLLDFSLWKGLVYQPPLWIPMVTGSHGLPATVGALVAGLFGAVMLGGLGLVGLHLIDLEVRSRPLD